MLQSTQNPGFLLHHRRWSRFHFPSKPLLLLPPTTRPLHTSPNATLTPTPALTQPPASQILAIRNSILSCEKTAVQFADECLSRIRLTEPRVMCFFHLSDAVLREAEEINRRIERKEEVGPLAGFLVAVKDNICTADMPSTAWSKILENYRPRFHATAVRKIKESGAIIAGKTNWDEFGMGSSTEGSAYQVTANSWDLERVPGGSSGGPAAAVSATQSVVSLGSDTGGSIRQPASFCGVVGLRPMYGRVSRYELVAYASSLDVIGCFGSFVADTGTLLQAISGFWRCGPGTTLSYLRSLQLGILLRQSVRDAEDEVISWKSAMESDPSPLH